jgi:hypothetical protein
VSAREKKITLKPEEWWSSAKFREQTLKQARRQARRHCVCVDIVLRDKFGVQRVARIDGRYWLFPEDNVPWEPPPTPAEQAVIDARKARTRRLRPPRGIFD